MLSNAVVCHLNGAGRRMIELPLVVVFTRRERSNRLNRLLCSRHQSTIECTRHITQPSAQPQANCARPNRARSDAGCLLHVGAVALSRAVAFSMLAGRLLSFAAVDVAMAAVA